jgi:hypothetical protein
MIKFQICMPLKKGFNSNYNGKTIFHTMLKAFIGFLILSSLIACKNENYYPYLDDAPDFSSRKKVAGHKGYPKINHSETKAKLDVESLRKYSEVSSTSADELPHYASVKAASPEVLIMRKFHPLNTIAHSSGNFFTTGPTTNWPEVFAGHWAYKEGKITRSSLSINETRLYLNNTRGLKVGDYAAIYDSPAGSFKNAEHVKITAIDSVNNQVSLVRGYKSEPCIHSSGSVFATHHVQANWNTNWTYNFSTTCPKDANGKILAEVRADWIAHNYYRQLDGTPVDSNLVDGVMLDAFSYYRKRGVDANNDFIIDDGIIGGKDEWIAGMNIFYERIRKKMPGKLLVDGGPNSWAFLWMNGTQMEVWPIGFHDGGNIEKAWTGQLMKMNSYIRHSAAPVYSEGLSRLPTKLYPFTNKNWDEKFPALNSHFRFGFALALMTGAFYGKENDRNYPDVWYDEYSVNVSVPPDNPDFGRAFENIPENQSLIRKNRGWMGEPVGNYKRIYDRKNFKPGKSLISDGGFEKGVLNWTGRGVSISDSAFKGLGALSVYAENKPVVTYTSENELDPGEYTLCFAVRSPEMSRFRVSFNNQRTDMICSPEWEKRVMVFRVDEKDTINLTFQQHEFGNRFSLDCVYLFKGNANILMREFENAVVYLNGTSEIQRIEMDLVHKYKKIQGTQDPLINDGSEVTWVEIDPYDAVILVKY